MHPKRYIADFDSSTALLRAVGAYLRGRDFPDLGMQPRFMTRLSSFLGARLNRLPPTVKDRIFTASGWSETIDPGLLDQVSMEDAAAWAAGQYDGEYSSVAIGSSNGAAAHLCAALRAPFLPQTFLVPVDRPGGDPDEPAREVEWSLGPARRLLDANPDVELHHMLDPVHDRLMARNISCFRVKKLRLGPSYERFIRERLAPGGTIFIVECSLSWPVRQVDSRHLFQFGGPGGATFEDYFQGTARTAGFLARYGSVLKRWAPPRPDAMRPEAEWGFEPALRVDIERFARQHGYRVRRLVFGNPDGLSPLVADLYRWWNARRGVIADRLIVESFVLVEPHRVARLGAVPFWLSFATEFSLDALEAYLDERRFDEIGMMLFPHGTESIRLASLARCRRLLLRARKRGLFIGVDEKAFPRDFAALFRYHTELFREFPSRYPLPGGLAAGEFDRFLAEVRPRWPVEMERREEPALELVR